MAEEVKYVLTLKDLLTPKLVQANKEADTLEKKMGGLGNAIALAFSGAAIVAFTQKVIQAGTVVENAKIGLTTLLGDANEAAGVIKNTMEDATKTPFAFEGLLAANKALISAGLNSKDARKDVLNLSNAIAATGGGDDELNRMVINLQQIKNTGEATALDIKQFAYAGINIYKVLEAAGIQYSKGQAITYEQITGALQKAHDKGGIYFNGLENMANSTSVKISNMGDAVFQLSVKIFNYLKPAIDATVGALTGAVQWIGANKDIIIALGAGVLTLAAAYVLYNGYLLYNNVLIVANNALTFLAMVASDGLAAALYAVGVAGTTMWAALTLGLSLVVTGLVYAYQKSITFRAVLGGIWGVAKALGNIFYGLGEIIVGAFSFSPSIFIQGAKDLANAAGNIGSAYAQGYAGVMQSVGGGSTTMGSVFGGAFAGLGGGKKKTETTAAGGPGGLGTPSSNVGGAKPTTINITINKLVEKLEIATTNITQGATKVKEEMTKAIVEAITDAQVIAGQ